MPGFLLTRRRALGASLAILLRPAFGASPSETAIVLLHGKQSAPSDMASLARDLRSAGCLVAVPDLPWSRSRDYDVPYGKALDEIETSAKELTGQGAKQIVVGGLSLGANAAIAYAASGRAVAGIFALAPGHVPERGGFRKTIAPGIEQAREMVAKGLGDDKAFFPDVNQGRTRKVRTSAVAYLSYFDPEGIGSMPRSAAAIPRPVPIFMVVGGSDPIAGYARSQIFQAAPAHEKSRYVESDSDHLGTLRIATAQLIDWIKSLTA